MPGRFSVEAVFKAVDKVTAPVTRMQNRVGKFTRKVRRNFKALNRQVTKFNQSIKNTGRTVAAAAAIMAVALTTALGPGVAFEQAITNVGAVSLKTRSQVALLEKQALELGATTKFTATQAANAMEILARAGFSTNEILTATPAVLSAAAASGLEIAEVAGVVSRALKGMGLETTEAARVADVLALASSRTQSSIGSLGESLSNVAQTAKTFGIPLEDVVAGVALLQDVGLDASVAGSAFNTMLTKMANIIPAMKKEMDELGISFETVEGNMLSFPKVLEQLALSAKKSGGNMRQVAFLAKLVGLRGQKAALGLADLFEKGKFIELTKELDNAAGSAEKMASLRMNTVQGSLLLLKSAVDAVGISFFKMNEGQTAVNQSARAGLAAAEAQRKTLKGTVDKITEWVSANKELIATKLGEWLQWIIENFETIITVATKLIKIMVGFMVFNAILKTIIGTMTLLNLVMSANPIGLIVLGIAALVGLAAVLYLAWEPIKAFFTDLWGSIVKGWDSLPGPLKTALKFAVNPIGTVAGALFGDDEDEQSQGARPQVVNPQDRVARSIEESRSVSELIISGDTEKATLAHHSGGPNGITMQPTGAF